MAVTPEQDCKVARCGSASKVSSKPDGVAMIELPSKGLNAQQPAVNQMADHIPPGILEDARDEIDRDVLSRSLLVAAKSVNEKFKERLKALFPEAKFLPSPKQLHEFDESEMLISVAPVKQLPRMLEKLDDAKRQGLEWPNSQQLGDPIRAMVICGKHRYEQMKHVWDTISGSDGFDVQVCKVNMAASNRPPDL